MLVTSSTYGDDGSLKETTDPGGLVTRTEYDAAGRTVTTIANYVNGVPSALTADDDQILRFVYANGHRTKYWVDLYPADTDGTPDSEDQVTAYTYGVAKGTSAGDSKVGSGSLLWKVQYPDSSGGTDVVAYAYNAQSQEIWRKDQGGNIHESDYDTGGRRTQDRVTTLGSGFDGAMRRIATTYDSSGRTELVTSHDNATQGSGSVLNEVRHAYDGWGNLTGFDLDRDSAVGGSGFYETTHTYATATGGRNTLRRSGSTQPGGATLSYNYLSTGGLHDADSSRASGLRLQIGGGSPVTVVEYRYNGVGDVVGREYPEPDVFWRQQGSSAGSYPDRDLFERIVKSRWTKDLSTDIDFVSFDIAYDRSSNIVSTEDSVYPAGFDVKYALDNLNRLTDADEGTLSGSSITSRTRRQQWTLTQTGNWDREKLDLNGDGDWSDADEHDETRTHNAVNEMLDRDTDSSSPVEFSQTYDAAGNLTDDGESYTYEYDAWNRLRRMRNRSTTALVAEHGYYGNGFRASEKYDTDVDGDVDGSDQTYFFAYDERWRIVAVFRGSDSDPKERFIAHAAGDSGLGGSSYIDDVVLRDRDDNTAWASASDGTLEQRRYYSQNWRHDVVALVTDDGKLTERDRYSSYGVPFGIPLGDVNGDGTTDSSDLGDILVAWGTGDVKCDLDLDGDVDGTDHTIANANFGTTLGRLRLSAVGNSRGFSGYQLSATPPSIYHIRSRAAMSAMGPWMMRDTLAYLDGTSLYQHVGSNPLLWTDPTGLSTLVMFIAKQGDINELGHCSVFDCGSDYVVINGPSAQRRTALVAKVTRAITAECCMGDFGTESYSVYELWQQLPPLPPLAIRQFDHRLANDEPREDVIVASETRVAEDVRLVLPKGSAAEPPGNTMDEYIFITFPDPCAGGVNWLMNGNTKPDPPVSWWTPLGKSINAHRATIGYGDCCPCGTRQRHGTCLPGPQFVNGS